MTSPVWATACEGGWATERQEVGDGLSPLIEQTKEQTIEQTPLPPGGGWGGGAMMHLRREDDGGNRQRLTLEHRARGDPVAVANPGAA